MSAYIVWPVALALVACSRENLRDVRAVERSTGTQAIVAGHYLGTLSTPDADYREYLRIDGPGGSAFYDGLRWVRICDFKDSAGNVSFRTATLFERAFAFEGTRHGKELRGALTGFWKPRDPIVFLRLDDEAAVPSPLVRRAGFYSDLRVHEETGDVLGAQLLVATIEGNLSVSLMIAEGAPGSPMAALAPTMNGDTLRFGIARVPDAPAGNAVFVDSGVEISFSNWVVPPERLPRTFNLSQFFEQPAEGVCP